MYAVHIYTSTFVQSL